MTGGVLEETLNSLQLKEGTDFYHFNWEQNAAENHRSPAGETGQSTKQKVINSTRKQKLSNRPVLVNTAVDLECILGPEGTVLYVNIFLY